MANIFGTDIEQLVSEAFAGQLRPGVLTRRSFQDAQGEPNRDIDDPTRVTENTSAPNPLTSPCECFVQNKTVTTPGSLETREQIQVLIIGGSVNALLKPPRVDDILIVDGQSYCLITLLKGDSSEAVYTFEGEAQP